MKRIGLFVLTIVLIVTTLTSCIIIPKYKKFKIDANMVESIEIYDLCEENSEFSYFIQTTSPVYKIPTEKTTIFLNDLAEIRFTDYIIIVLAAIDPGFNYDTWTVRINYRDGSYQLLSSAGYGETYDEKGDKIDSHHFGCDQEEWWGFIGKYVPENLFNHSHSVE